jgi:hypothetical protein
MSPIFDNHLPLYNAPFDTGGKLFRVLVRGVIDDGIRIKYGHIGVESLFDDAFGPQPQLFGRQ